MIKLIPEGCFPNENLLTHISKLVVTGMNDDFVPLITHLDLASDALVPPSSKGAVYRSALYRYRKRLLPSS
jgi:hypothetical protein